MDPGANPATAPARPISPFSAWPITVQIALAFLVTASVFFLLGRWSHAEPAAVNARELEPPATIDLNLATKSELRLLPGLGDALAQRVIDHRQRIGRFKSVDELRQVSGIGPKTLERLRPHLFVIAAESFVATDDSEPMAAPGKPAPAARSSTKVAKLTEPINVNTADQKELQKLPGIGPKLSQRIIDEREKVLFKTVDELRRVPGIGPKTLEKLRPFVTVGGST